MDILRRDGRSGRIGKANIRKSKVTCIAESESKTRRRRIGYGNGTAESRAAATETETRRKGRPLTHLREQEYSGDRAELYTAPFIFLPLETVSNGKGYKLKNPFSRFDVKEIEYTESRKNLEDNNRRRTRARSIPIPQGSDEGKTDGKDGRMETDEKRACLKVWRRGE